MVEPLLLSLFSRQSLTLLEYLLKTGDDRVLLKMKDNIYIVKALTEYRFIEKDGKDQVGRASSAGWSSVETDELHRDWFCVAPFEL